MEKTPRPFVQQEDEDAYLSRFSNLPKIKERKSTMKAYLRSYKAAHVLVDLQLILKRTSRHKPLRTILGNNLESFCHSRVRRLFSGRFDVYSVASLRPIEKNIQIK